MSLETKEFRESVLKAVVASAISLPLTKIAMESYAALTVSLNPDNIVGTMINGAMIINALIVALTVFTASYIGFDFESR